MSVDVKATFDGIVAVLSLIGGLGTPLQQVLHKRTGQTVEGFKAEFEGLKSEHDTLKKQMADVQSRLEGGGTVMTSLTVRLDSLQKTVESMDKHQRQTWAELREDMKESAAATAKRAEELHDDIRDLSKSLIECVRIHAGGNRGT
jgi:predicted  nucleic acid-binding Zn-ribbon protein